MGQNDPNNAQAVIDAVERLANVKIENVEGTPLAIVPRGMELQSIKPFLDERRDHPERRTGTAVLESVDSFVEYVNRFKSETNTAIFATDGKDRDEPPALVGIIDHHQPGGAGEARFCLHRTAYRFPLSEQWIAWMRADGNQISQEAFAEFIEDRLLDVREPSEAGKSAAKFAADFGLKLASPAQLRDLSRGLSVRVNQIAAQKINTTTGETTLAFSEDHAADDGTPIAVPGGFILGIPVFHAGAPYQIEARLRYRVHGKAVHWTVKLHRTDRVFQHAFDEAVALVAEKTGCVVFRGHPESLR